MCIRDSARDYVNVGDQAASILERIKDGESEPNIKEELNKLNAFGGLIPNFSRLYGRPKQVLKFDTGPEGSYGRSYVGKTLKSGKLFLTQNGYPYFAEYMKKSGKPVPSMQRGNVGGKDGFWANQYENELKLWAQLPNQERLDAAAERRKGYQASPLSLIHI